MNELHHIGSIDGPFLLEDGVVHLVEYEIHHINLPFMSFVAIKKHLVSMIHEIHQTSVNGIGVACTRINILSEHADEDIIDGTQVLGVTL
jgi:pyrrolidone-carboxylate peptidase